MQHKSKSTSDEILKTARDMLKAYVRANPDSIRDSDPEVLLELHRRFVEGLTKQTDELLAEPPPPNVHVNFVTQARPSEASEVGAPAT